LTQPRPLGVLERRGINYNLDETAYMIGERGGSSNRVGPKGGKRVCRVRKRVQRT